MGTKLHTQYVAAFVLNICIKLCQLQIQCVEITFKCFCSWNQKKKNETHEEKNCEHFGGFESAGLLKRYSLTVFDFLAHKFNAHPINYDCISNVIGACCLGKLDGVPFVYTILLRKPQK